MAAERTTPTKGDKEITDSEEKEEEEEESFGDAADITPRAGNSSSKPIENRSLTDRRSLSTSKHDTEGSNSSAEIHQPSEKIAAVTDHGPAPISIDGTVDNQVSGPEADKISMTDMDDINLGEDSQSAISHSSTPTQTSTIAVPLKHKTAEAVVSPISSHSNGSPPTPPASDKLSSATSIPSIARKFNSPFSWLSRGTGGSEKKPPSPPLLMSPPLQANGGRRNTASSINSELMVNKLHVEGDDGHGSASGENRNSLKDRFKLLRMREEAGIASVDENSVSDGSTSPNTVFAGLMSRSASLGFGAAGQTATASEQEMRDTAAVQPAQKSSSSATTPTGRQATINLNLAPGTASGMASGPPGPSDAPVDWDLWQSVVYEGPAAVARTSPEELNSSIANGIPQAIRGVVWQVLAKSKNEDLENIYRELVVRGTDKERTGTNGHTSVLTNSSKDKESVASSASSMHSERSTPAITAGAVSPHHSLNGEPNDVISKLQNRLHAVKSASSKEETAKIQKLEKVIKRDLGARTSYSKYVMAAGLQDGLFGVCKAYALYDEAVGYAQGMNFIVMPLLFNMPEEEAFCMLVRLMSKYGLRELFIQDMPGLHLHLYQFERLLEDFEPALFCHLHRRGVNPNLYATQWFLTLFAYRFPLQLVLRIYDLILSEGLEGAILKFGIVLMRRNKDALLAMKDMAQLTTYLKDRLFDVYIDKAPSANSLLDSGFFGSGAGVDKEVYRADVLVQDACAIKITPDMLKQYTVEWEEKLRVEKERETELEDLRSSCSNLTTKLRRMEERAETNDTEHVQMASDVVRTKVQNESLQDENESLRGQVEELKNVVQHQTEEVEKRMRAEMDAVMAKNSEVHNINRELESEKQEMERLLVETKMQYAQVNSEYETIKQKWSNVQQMLNSQ